MPEPAAVGSYAEDIGAAQLRGGGPSSGARLDVAVRPPFRPRHSFARLGPRTFLRDLVGQLLMTVAPLDGLTTRLGLRVATSQGEQRVGPVVQARYRGFRSAEPWDQPYVVTPDDASDVAL